jgi:quinone-modifying oxidoreductase subunit QmoA
MVNEWRRTNMANAETQSILVIGGGISGLTAAIEAAEAGYDAYIVDKNPYVGGRVAQLHRSLARRAILM